MAQVIEQTLNSNSYTAKKERKMSILKNKKIKNCK
jgi:hypothetical protein